MRWVVPLYGVTMSGLGLLMLVVHFFAGEKGAPLVLALIFLGFGLLMWVTWLVTRPPRNRKYENNT